MRTGVIREVRTKRLAEYCTVDNFTRGYPLRLTPAWITRRVRGTFPQVDSGYPHVK